ncbi:MAG: hypothetical protein KGM93_18455, partial [Sphingomonadales bacterium]|nr:hypothetical protein [Sphingomonadales bacterium]
MEINRYRLQESQYLQQVRSDQKILEPPPQAAPTHTSESLPSADKLLASVKPPPDATHSPDAKAKPTADEVFGPVTPPPDKVDAQTNAAFAKALAGADGTPTPTDDA